MTDFPLQSRRTSLQVLVNKKLILSLPPDAPRPANGTKLGNALANYILRCNLMYDPAFDDAVREKYPHWFIDRTKELLLLLPPNSPRPKDPLRRKGLRRYTDKRLYQYDADFDATMRANQPRWFMDRMSRNKAELLDLPDGSPRPSADTVFGKHIRSYLDPKSPRYDADFTAAVRERFPNWLSGVPAANKEALLAMAPDAPRPKARTTLGAALANYTQKSNPLYDPEFDATVRERFPLWFAGKAAYNRAILLAMPLGSPRPLYGTPLADALRSYVGPSSPCFDAAFATAIRERFPDWFNRPADTAGNKAAILALPEGSPKPPVKSQLGQALRSYTQAAQGCYDAEFTAAVWKRFPHWFAVRTGVKDRLPPQDHAYLDPEPTPLEKAVRLFFVGTPATA